MFREWVQSVPDCLQGGKNEVATLGCLPAIFLNVVSALLVFAGTFALFLIIMSGYKYMNTGGDPKKLESAKNTIIYGALGLSIVLFSYFVIDIISAVTNVPCIKLLGFGCNP